MTVRALNFLCFSCLISQKSKPSKTSMSKDSMIRFVAFFKNVPLVQANKCHLLPLNSLVRLPSIACFIISTFFYFPFVKIRLNKVIVTEKLIPSPKAWESDYQTTNYFLYCHLLSFQSKQFAYLRFVLLNIK